MKKNNLLTAGLFACVLFLLPACKTTDTPKEDKELDRILTPEEVAKMSPEELEKYKQKLRRKQEKEKREKANAKIQERYSVEAWKEHKRAEKEKKLDVSRPISEENMGSAYPWRTTRQRRSEELHDSMHLENR